MLRFNVLIKCWYPNGYVNWAALSVFALSEEEAEEEADRIIDNKWGDVQEYEIITISKNGFFLKKWNITAEIITKNSIEPRKAQLRVSSPDSKRAEEVAKETLMNRAGVLRVEILSSTLIPASCTY
jgi:hypothetical protein